MWWVRRGRRRTIRLIQEIDSGNRQHGDRQSGDRNPALDDKLLWWNTQFVDGPFDEIHVRFDLTDQSQRVRDFLVAEDLIEAVPDGVYADRPSASDVLLNLE